MYSLEVVTVIRLGSKRLFACSTIKVGVVNIWHHVWHSVEGYRKLYTVYVLNVLFVGVLG